MYTEKNFAVSLMRNMVIPTFVLDASGRVIVWNRACEQLTGVSAEGVMGTTEHWRAFYSEKRPVLADVLLSGDRSLVKELYTVSSEVGSDSETLRAENWCYMPVLGHRRYLALDAGPVYGENGSLVAVVETLRDMTELKNAQDELLRLATIDGLTDLGNRRYFDAQLSSLWGTAMRHSQPLSLLLIDIDYFKKYNDQYGHIRGDAVLREVAQLLAGSLQRSSDQCFRYGGEEFCVLLPDTDRDGAAEVAERIAVRVREFAIPHKASSVAAHVTLSIGGCTLTPTRGQREVDLLACADQQLYAAKGAGRNQSILVDYAKAPLK